MNMEILYEEGKRFKALNRGLELIIDQSFEAGGSNQGFTPPELFVASLGSCVGVYVVNFCERHNIDLNGMKISLNWQKAKEPARIGQINCIVDIPASLDQQMATAILKVAEHCLIHNTLTQEPGIDVRIEIIRK